MNLNELADSSYYIESGKQVLGGINPYNFETKWGSLGAVIFYLFFGLLPKQIAILAITVLNIVGIYLFARILELNRYHSITVTSIVLISAINRENIVNLQITGIILLSIALATLIPSNFISDNFVALLLLFSLEMKPHVSLPLIIILGFKNRFPYKKMFLIGLLLHVLLDLINGRILEIDFLGQLLKRSTENMNQKWENSNNLLPLIDAIVVNPTVVKILGIIITIIAFKFLLTGSRTHKIVALITMPLVMPYFHLYDLLGILIIVLAHFFRSERLSILSTCSILILLSPLQPLNALTLIVLVMVLTVLLASGISVFYLGKIRNLSILLFLFPNLIGLTKFFPLNLVNSAITTSSIIAMLILDPLARRAKSVESA